MYWLLFALVPCLGHEFERQTISETHTEISNQIHTVALLRDPSYAVMAPRVVRAGNPYNLVVNILAPTTSLVLRATLLKDNIQLDTIEQECFPYEPHVLSLKVPGSSTNGVYRLQLEGNEVGWLTGSSFHDEMTLFFSPRSATVLVQTDKPLYRQGTTVRMRIVALDGSVRMVTDSVDIFLLSPRGAMMKRWLSRQCGEGAVNLDYLLSESAEEGHWTIRVEATNSFAEKKFKVEKFHKPLFEVQVDIPAFLSSSEEYLQGHISANYSSGAPVSGNISVSASVSSMKDGIASYRTQPLLLRRQAKFSGGFSFKFHLSDLESLISWKENVEVEVTATVGDALWDTTHSAFSTVRIYGANVILKFLGESPFIMRPSMPFTYYLAASMEDGSHVPEWRLAHYRLLVTPEVHFRNGITRKLSPRTIKMTHDHYALWKEKIEAAEEIGPEDNEEDIESLTLNADLKDATGLKTYTSLVVIVQHSHKGRHLQLSTSTKEAKVGEFVILHVRTNFYLSRFRYILISKEVIIEAGQEDMEASLKTLPLALSPETVGMTTVVVYAMERGQEIVADAITFPVSPASDKHFSISVQSKVHNRHLRVAITGAPGSRISLSGTNVETFKMKSTNDFTQQQIVSQLISDSKVMYGGQTKTKEPLIQKWNTKDGFPDQYLYLPKMSIGIDPNSTFEHAGMQISSDGNVPMKPAYCSVLSGMKPCLLRGCYTAQESCDKKWDCFDRIDEAGCEEDSADKGSPIQQFNIGRQSRTSRHFMDPWLWTEVLLDESGRTALAVPTPETSSDLVLTAFSMHRRNGLSVYPQPILIGSTTDVWMDISGPSHAGLWEQVGIRVTIINHTPDYVSASLILADNEAYKFVSLDEFNKAQYQHTGSHPINLPAIRIKRGEHQHTIIVPSGSSHSLALPIMPIKIGEIVVSVQASLTDRKLSKSTKIIIEPMGAKQEHHTSLLLDLNSRAYLFTFLDVKRPEPHVPKSAKSHITIFGDFVGGISPNAASSPSELLNLPEVGCEPTIFKFLMGILQLNHWKELNQLPEKNVKKIFGELALSYQTILSYQNMNGGFHYYKYTSSPSVWLTALTLRALNEASSKWSHLLYIDPQVTDKAIRFILKHQSATGTFLEPSGSVGIRTLDSATSFGMNDLNTRGLNLSSTAFTVMQMMALKELPAPLDNQVFRSILKSRSMFERHLDLISRASKPLEIALVTHILHGTKSAQADRSFGILARNARQEVKYMYWGEDSVSLPSYRIESQRPHLQPRKYHRHDSANIAATAIALQVYTQRGELLTSAIVRWLNSQRAHDRGWMSTLDSLLAWEALHEYSKQKNSARNVHVTVTIEPMRSLSVPRVFYVTSDNVLHLQKHQFNDLNGAIRVQGKGNGSAVLQLTSSYHTATKILGLEPPVKAFHLHTRASASGKNSSTLTFQSCIKWLYLEASSFSGMSVLEVTVPTGYGLPSEKLSQYVASRVVSGLREARFEARKIKFFFEKVSQSETCVDFSVNRWFPVANLTKVLPVTVYEYYSPELYEREFLDMSSVTLNICEVCGSYQCPNCPVLSYYSSQSQNLLVNSILILFSILFYYVSS